LLEAFIKAVQIVVGLKTQQDIHACLGALMTTHMPATWAAFVEVHGSAQMLVRQITTGNSATEWELLTEDVRPVVSDVLETGFLATAVVLAPEPSMTVFLPVVEESQAMGVMLVGHMGIEPVSRDLLDIYLAIAGLAGATLERLKGELELTRHRSHLEELVDERTAELHAERERLAITLRSIGDGVIATDTDERIVLLNSAAEGLTGWKPEEALGRPIADVFDIIHEVTREPAEIPVRRALDSGTVVELANHTTLLAKDGTELAIADSCAPIRALDGSVTGAVLVFRDVTERHRYELLREALNLIDATIATSLDAAAILRDVTLKAALALGCPEAVVLLPKNRAWEVGHATEAASSMHGLRFVFDGWPTEGPRLVRGEGLRAILPGDLIEAREPGSLLIVPVVVKGDTVAMLGFFDLPELDGALEMRFDFARKLAASLSLGLENARLYAEERHIAETLQEALVCMPQRYEEIDLSHLYHSATRAAKVGGDFYDVFRMQGDRIGILMGDVAGKGVSAAAVAMMVRNTVKTFAHQGCTPGEVMSKANEVILRETDPRVFVTVFFGVLDIGSGLLTFCNAGHPPALLKRGQGLVEALRTASPVIGVFGSADFAEKVTSLSIGDTLVLYTDGLIESRPPGGELFGEDRLLVAIHAPLAPAAMTQHLFDAIMGHTGGELNDDLAILSLARVS
jgi:PAS domain S-box-containing protein